jgi:hypothetical protein
MKALTLGCVTPGCPVRTPFEFCERCAAERISMMEAEAARIGHELARSKRVRQDLGQRLLMMAAGRAVKASYPPGMPAAVVAVQEAAAAHLGVSVAELQGSRGDGYRSRARGLAMAAVRRVTGASLPVLGRAFHRHHTSVMAAIRAAEPAEVEAAVAAVRSILMSARCPLLMSPAATRNQSLRADMSASTCIERAAPSLAARAEFSQASLAHSIS